SPLQVPRGRPARPALAGPRRPAALSPPYYPRVPADLAVPRGLPGPSLPSPRGVLGGRPVRPHPAVPGARVALESLDPPGARRLLAGLVDPEGREVPAVPEGRP